MEISAWISNNERFAEWYCGSYRNFWISGGIGRTLLQRIKG